MAFYTITIPATSKSRYLSGLSALNLPSLAGTGDWHMTETFFIPRKKRSLSFICGDGCAVNTNDIFSDAGIYDCTEILDKLRIRHESIIAYAASHARAIVDLLVGAIVRCQRTDHVVLEDWMPGKENSKEVHDLLSMTAGHLTTEQDKALQNWLVKNAVQP